jgi:hypothetical protein
LSSRSPEESAHLVAAFHQGLAEGGFIDGQNVVGNAIGINILVEELLGKRLGLLHELVPTASAGGLNAAPPSGVFKQALGQLGWSEGHNVQIDIRWGEDDVDRERKSATELMALAPDIVLATGASKCGPCSVDSTISMCGSDCGRDNIQKLLQALPEQHRSTRRTLQDARDEASLTGLLVCASQRSAVRNQNARSSSLTACLASSRHSSTCCWKKTFLSSMDV